MNEMDEGLHNFFKERYRPGLVGLVGTKNYIGKAIREAQSSITEDGKASLWSHCFILGASRTDRRGPGRTLTQSIYIFESDLSASLYNPQLRNGAQENWIGKWCNVEVENAAVIDFGLPLEQTDYLLATALQLADEQISYPIQELLGTWWAIVVNKQWMPNLLDDPHAMFCSAFVRYCHSEAGKDFLGDQVSVSNTTPEDIAQAGMRAQTITVYKA